PEEGVRRRCESCHSLTDTHDWLPQRERHFAAVACEACHVPELEMAAQQSIDQTVILLDGAPQVSYRGVEGDVRNASKAYVQGYRPLLRVGKNVYGEHQVLPYNLVSKWYWTDSDSHEPVSQQLLRSAWLDGNNYNTAIMEAFDANQDGQLAADELRIDNHSKLLLVKEHLREAGVKNPTVRGEVSAYPIHHNVRHGNRVNRDCSVCHPGTEKDLPVFDLAPYVPANMKPVLVQENTEIMLDGKWQIGGDDGLQFAPNSGVARSWQTIESTIRSEP
ncbi:MAG: hypothetical protein WBN81_15375, partial [Gammaproteobacteria bacterium]